MPSASNGGWLNSAFYSRMRMELGGPGRRRRSGTSEAHKELGIATPGTRRHSKICFRQPLYALPRRGPLSAVGGPMQISVVHLSLSVPAVRRALVRHVSSIRHSVRAQMSGEYKPPVRTSTTGGMPTFVSLWPDAD